MKHRITTLVIALTFLLAACVGDPNESEVPDDKDFRNYDVEYVAGDLIVDIYFYSDFNLSEFFFYFDTDGLTGADYLVKCRLGEFLILKESATSPGLYDDLKYTGVPTVTDDKYHLEFPLDALDPDFDPDFTAHYWFFAIEVGDRMPDSGNVELTIIG